MAMIAEAMAEAINAVATRVYEQSQVEVPRGDNPRDQVRHDVTLAESGRYPGNDPELAATPTRLEATVTYDAEYAMAQHEGVALMHRASGEVPWVVTNYTTEGTKSHYLEDPLKAEIGGLEAAVGLAVQARLAL